MQGSYLLIFLTFTAVMLNSRIIRWQHSLLAKGCELTDVPLEVVYNPLRTLTSPLTAGDTSHTTRRQTLLSYWATLCVGDVQYYRDNFARVPGEDVRDEHMLQR